MGTDPIELPISYEQVRSLVMRAIARIAGIDAAAGHSPPQIGTVFGHVATVAIEDGIVSVSKPESRHHQWHLSAGDQSRVSDVMWDLCFEGIIRPGDNRGGEGAFPFYHLTDLGYRVARGQQPSPYDPDGYLARLKESWTDIDVVILTYLEESMRTFRIGCLLASSVTLGAASEKAVLVLVDELLTRLPPQAAAQFKKKAGDRIATIFAEVRKVMERLRPVLPLDVKDGLSTRLDGIFDMIRELRNDAGHPTGQLPSRDVVFAHLTVFPSYLAKIKSLIDWLRSQPADSIA